MANILYSGQTLPISKDVDTEELMAVILDTSAKGSHAWITLSLAGANKGTLQLLIGPGIPVAIVDD